jgi:hypothetical protein
MVSQYIVIQFSSITPDIRTISIKTAISRTIKYQNTDLCTPFFYSTVYKTRPILGSAVSVPYSFCFKFEQYILKLKRSRRQKVLEYPENDERTWFDPFKRNGEPNGVNG